MEHRQLREVRLRRQNELRGSLEKVIPLRYCRARYSHISQAVRDAISRAPRDTGFVLYGPPGVGKTYTLAAFIRAIITGKRGGVVRVTWDALLADVRTAYKSDGDSEKKLIGKYQQPSHLIIEDLATTAINQEETPFAVRILTAILEYRLEHCLPMYVSTNKTKAEIGRSFDGRIASRFELFDWIGIGGRDKRRRDGRP